MPLPTLDQLKAHLNLATGAQNDAELQSKLDAAVGTVSGIVGPLVPEPVTEVHPRFSGDTLVLTKAPVAAVTSLGSASTGSPLPPSHYVVGRTTGIVRMLAGRYLAGDVTVTYSAGWADLPADIHLAVLIIAAHLWETQRVPGRSPSPGFGQAGQPTVPIGYAIPNRAADLLAPHRLGPLP